MQKFTLTHIGALALGRLLAIWSFVLGLIFLVLYTFAMIIMALVGIVAGTDIVATIIGLVIGMVMGVVGLFVGGIVMFIFGFLAATVYNIILGIGGGVDIDLKERN